MNELINVSRNIGCRLDLIQAGGGNTSVKQGNTLIVKASGYKLCNVSKDHGLSVLNLKALTEELISVAELNEVKDKEELERISNQVLFNSKLPENIDRPSIETFLHSFGRQYTIHTHPTIVSVFCSSEQLFTTLKDTYPQYFFVDYATPGLELFLLVYNEVYKNIKDDSRSPIVIFMKNHGLIVSHDIAAEAEAITYDIVESLSTMLGVSTKTQSYAKITTLKNSLNLFIDSQILVKKIENDRVVSYLNSMNSADIFTFSPDIAVFLGEKICHVTRGNIEKEIHDHYHKHGESPSLIAFEGDFYVSGKNYEQLSEKNDVVNFYCDVMLMLDKDDSRTSLNESEVNYLNNWESEKYRK